MRRLRSPARRLRHAIDAMPIGTRKAMLDAVATSPIIVGAYTSPEGGVCPMLAAHRNGGRTSYAEFAWAWDAYADAGREARPATEREVAALRAMLEDSIANEAVSGVGAFARAIADHHRALYARVRREEHEVTPLPAGKPEATPLPAEGPDYIASPGRANSTSGTMHAGEVLSR